MSRGAGAGPLRGGRGAGAALRRGGQRARGREAGSMTDAWRAVAEERAALAAGLGHLDEGGWRGAALGGGARGGGRAVAEERAALAADLGLLDEGGWREPSLCAGLSVEEVVAHLTAGASSG